MRTILGLGGRATSRTNEEMIVFTTGRRWMRRIPPIRSSNYSHATRTGTLAVRSNTLSSTKHTSGQLKRTCGSMIPELSPTISTSSSSSSSALAPTEEPLHLPLRGRLAGRPIPIKLSAELGFSVTCTSSPVSGSPIPCCCGDARFELLLPLLAAPLLFDCRFSRIGIPETMQVLYFQIVRVILLVLHPVIGRCTSSIVLRVRIT